MKSFKKYQILGRVIWEKNEVIIIALSINQIFGCKNLKKPRFSVDRRNNILLFYLFT